MIVEPHDRCLQYNCEPIDIAGSLNLANDSHKEFGWFNMVNATYVSF